VGTRERDTSTGVGAVTGRELMSDNMLSSEEATVPLAQLTAALDEIYLLRRALAYEAEAIRAHMSYARFPKSRRPIAEGQIERMHGAARGEVARRYAEVSGQSLDRSMVVAGAKTLLTRSQWVEEKPWL
jgi:hypothetical protein